MMGGGIYNPHDDNKPFKDDEDAPDQETLLSIMAHPVTAVYCDREGIIWYERYDFEPLKLNMISAQRSRQTALRRLKALFEMHGEDPDDPYSPLLQQRISDSGRGLTYKELREQTMLACIKSRELEAKRAEDAEAKRRKYGLN